MDTPEPPPAPLPVEIVSSPGVLDWITAIGTVGAVIVALGVAGAEFFRHRDERRRAQASLVTAWIRTVSENEYDPNSRDFGIYTIHNGSTAPVFEFVATLPTWMHMGSGNKPFVTHPIMLTPTTEPMSPWDDPPEISHFGDAAVRITFRDTSGRWWERRDDGTLHHLRHKPVYDE